MTEAHTKQTTYNNATLVKCRYIYIFSVIILYPKNYFSNMQLNVTDRKFLV